MQVHFTCPYHIVVVGTHCAQVSKCAFAIADKVSDTSIIMLVTFLVFAAVVALALVLVVLYLMPGAARNSGSTVPGMEPTDEK